MLCTSIERPTVPELVSAGPKSVPKTSPQCEVFFREAVGSLHCLGLHVRKFFDSVQTVPRHLYCNTAASPQQLFCSSVAAPHSSSTEVPQKLHSSSTVALVHFSTTPPQPPHSRSTAAPQQLYSSSRAAPKQPPLGETKSKAGLPKWAPKKEENEDGKRSHFGPAMRSNPGSSPPPRLLTKTIPGPQCGPILVPQCGPILVPQNGPAGSDFGSDVGVFFESF